MDKFSPYIDELHKMMECQDEKWGPDRDHSMPLWLTILSEEFGEVGRAILDKDLDNLKAELIDLASLCIQIRRSLDVHPDTKFR